jgi:hypothetical protein
MILGVPYTRCKVTLTNAATLAGAAENVQASSRASDS